MLRPIRFDIKGLIAEISVFIDVHVLRPEALQSAPFAARDTPPQEAGAEEGSPRALYGRLPKASQSKTGRLWSHAIWAGSEELGKGRWRRGGVAMNETARNSL
jgi:hypothetical protein